MLLLTAENSTFFPRLMDMATINDREEMMDYSNIQTWDDARVVDSGPSHTTPVSKLPLPSPTCMLPTTTLAMPAHDDLSKPAFIRSLAYA